MRRNKQSPRPVIPAPVAVPPPVPVARVRLDEVRVAGTLALLDAEGRVLDRIPLFVDAEKRPASIIVHEAAIPGLVAQLEQLRAEVEARFKAGAVAVGAQPGEVANVPKA